MRAAFDHLSLRRAFDSVTCASYSDFQYRGKKASSLKCVNVDFSSAHAYRAELSGFDQAFCLRECSDSCRICFIYENVHAVVVPTRWLLILGVTSLGVFSFGAIFASLFRRLGHRC